MEITINPDEMHDELILTKIYKLRGIVLHDLKQTLFDYGGSTFYYRDLIVYMDDGVLVVGVDDDGQGIK